MSQLRTLLCVVLCFAFFGVTCGCGSKQVKKDEDFNPEKFLTKAAKLIDDKEYEEARKVLFEVKNRDLTKKYAPLAQLRIADSYIKDSDPDHGIDEYRKFLDLYPDNQHASYAQYQIA